MIELYEQKRGRERVRVEAREALRTMDAVMMGFTGLSEKSKERLRQDFSPSTTCFVSG